MKTLRDKSVIIETYFLGSTPEGDTLIAFMKAESFEQSRHTVEKSTHHIDQYHQQFKQDTWGSVEIVEMLVDLDRISEMVDQKFQDR